MLAAARLHVIGEYFSKLVLGVLGVFPSEQPSLTSPGRTGSAHTRELLCQSVEYEVPVFPPLPPPSPPLHSRTSPLSSGTVRNSHIYSALTLNTNNWTSLYYNQTLLYEC